MVRRCPGARLLGRASLPNHRVALLADGFATVHRDPGATAFGVLWELSFADMVALDRYEGVAQGAYRKFVQPVRREGASPVRALVYIGVPGKSLGRAPPDYMGKIVQAARAAGLCGEHVDFLRRLAGEEVTEEKKFRAIKTLVSL